MLFNQKSTLGIIFPTINLMAVSTFMIVLSLAALSATPKPLVESSPAHYSPKLELPSVDSHTGSPELRGSLIALSENRAISKLVFTVAGSSEAIPLSQEDGSISVNYRDPNQRIKNLPWSWQFQGVHNQNQMLEQGERLQMIVSLADSLRQNLSANTPFEIEIVSDTGQLLTIQRTTPTQLEPIIDLY